MDVFLERELVEHAQKERYLLLEFLYAALHASAGFFEHGCVEYLFVLSFFGDGEDGFF